MKWYIGQPIVAIKNHVDGIFKNGDEFVIQGLKTQPCCGRVTIYIGIQTSHGICECVCGIKSPNDNYWDSKNFAPLDVDISELTELLTNKEVNH
jgi:hypothetical protein